jgi:hypothetical protein
MDVTLTVTPLDRRVGRRADGVGEDVIVVTAYREHSEPPVGDLGAQVGGSIGDHMRRARSLRVIFV